LLSDTDCLLDRISERLQDCLDEAAEPAPANGVSQACVMLLLGPQAPPGGGPARPCLILNKRSEKVRQPGDLCCPGGGITPGVDSVLARLLGLPISPLTRWPHWQRWREYCPAAARDLALRLATAVRESLEEMRLNPLGIRFLGPLPPQRLVVFRRVIYPLAGWIPRQRRFFPNWEVEKIVRVPLQDFFCEKNYGRYRLSLPAYPPRGIAARVDDFPCFIHRSPEGKEVLWGATFRIVSAFLKEVFDFTPPNTEGLPVVTRHLDESYYGEPRKANRP
jgi:hypothetical protein